MEESPSTVFIFCCNMWTRIKKWLYLQCFFAASHRTQALPQHIFVCLDTVRLQWFIFCWHWRTKMMFINAVLSLHANKIKLSSYQPKIDMLPYSSPCSWSNYRTFSGLSLLHYQTLRRWKKKKDHNATQPLNWSLSTITNHIF